MLEDVTSDLLILVGGAEGTGKKDNISQVSIINTVYLVPHLLLQSFQ